MAAEASDATLLATPPAPAKIVVDPMMDVRTEPPSVIKDWIADVVTADPIAPPAPSVPVVVSVTVADGDVTRVVAVAVPWLY